MRKNDSLVTILRPFAVEAKTEALFERHKRRFKGDVPNSIYDFVSADANASPTEMMECCVYEQNELLAVSYFDVGDEAASGVYAMFEPAAAGRSLGIFTMLKEIEYAAAAGKQFYYLGYSYEGNSFYDYKKRFRGTEMFDWNGNWVRFQELTETNDVQR